MMRLTAFLALVIWLVLPAATFAAYDEANDRPSFDPPKTKYKVDRRGGGKLYTTGSTVRVYNAPKSGARLLRSYDRGAIMVLLGAATGTPYVWVSPCNACDPGFALRSEFMRGSQ